MNSVEKTLISTELLSQQQIDEIREMFMIVDADKSGEVSYDEVAIIMTKLSKSQISKEEALKIIQKIDLNGDGVITWEEFLQVMYDWLKASNYLDQGKKDGTNPTERKILHLNLANFFMQFNQDKNSFLIQALHTEHNIQLEDRIEAWDFFWTKTNHTNEEKWFFYQENQKLLDKFSIIVQQVHANDAAIVLEGLKNTVNLLLIVHVFKTPAERFEISSHIIRIFDLICNSNLINKICYILNNTENPMILWECLKIVTIFAPGPRIANTPETSILHPNQMFHKILLGNNGVVQRCLKLTQSNCIEVKEQAILAVGFLVRGSSDIRDLIVSLGGVQVLCDTINQESSIPLVQRMSLTLSLIAGVPNKRDASALSTELTKTTLTLVQAFSWLLFWKDDIDVLSNSLLGLSYLLPQIELNFTNSSIWERVVKMLTHNNLLVKRSALNCLKNIVVNNELQCQYCVEQKLLVLLSELLHFANVNIKVEACSLITVLAKRGYSWHILDSSVISNIIRIIYEESYVRWDCVKTLEKLSSQNGESNKILLEAGVVKAIFSNLHGFKDYDTVLSEIYGYLDASYNFKYLTDSIQVLQNLLNVTSGISNLNEYATVLRTLLEQGNFDKLKSVLDTIFVDIKDKKIEYTQLSLDIHTFFQQVAKFLSNCLALFKNAPIIEYTSRMLVYLTGLQSALEKMFAEIDKLGKDNQMTVETPIQKTLEIRCFSKENFPNGDNRVIDVNSNITLMELILQIEHRYQRSPITLHYIDEFKDQITIDSDSLLHKAIQTALQDSKATPSDKTIVKLIVNSPNSMLKMGASFINTNFKPANLFSDKMIDIFSGNTTNLLNKENLLQELGSKTSLTKFELEKIYDSFVQITIKRNSNQANGTVNFQEFMDIMKGFISDINTIEGIFRALDYKNTKEIDFRDFVCAMSLIKSGNIEDKLKVAFMSYDIDHNGYIDRQEMSQLVVTSARTRGMSMCNHDVETVVNEVFAKADANGDGVLSFDEFKFAVLNSQILINPFWTSSQVTMNMPSQTYTLA